MNRTLFYKGVFWGLVVLFSYIFIVNAWVVDDAYITFRTVDNFTHGYGLTWNIQERVQAYSHPLWMFVISFFYLFTSEAFYTSIVVSFLLCIATFALAYFAFKNRRDNLLWKPSFLVLTLIASKAFMDYTSSGLENPLSYFLAMLFYSKFLLGKQEIAELSEKDLFFLFFIAALAFFNRQDTLLLYLPPLVYLIFVHLRKVGYRLVPLILLATLPATGWLVFSLVYYGFPFPNTAYGKSFTPGLAMMDKIEWGLGYLENSISWDSASQFVFLSVIIVGLYKKSPKILMPICGAVLYFIYVITDAAAATHMSGRFFSVPLFIAFLVFSELISTKRTAMFVSVLIILYVIASPLSPIKMGTVWYESPPNQNPGLIDTNWYAHNEGAALIDYSPGKVMPDHQWFRAGVEFRNNPAEVHIGGALGSGAVGYFGYAADSAKYIVDYLGLTDPLLARLPACTMAEWKSGHFFRVIPDGYIESVKEGRNLIEDPALRSYYDKLLNITRGPLFSRQRFLDILEMNLGHYQYLLQPYASKVAREYAETDCRPVIRQLAGPVY